MALLRLCKSVDDVDDQICLLRCRCVATSRTWWLRCPCRQARGPQPGKASTIWQASYSAATTGWAASALQRSNALQNQRLSSQDLFYQVTFAFRHVLQRVLLGMSLAECQLIGLPSVIGASSLMPGVAALLAILSHPQFWAKAHS